MANTSRVNRYLENKDAKLHFVSYSPYTYTLMTIIYFIKIMELINMLLEF